MDQIKKILSQLKGEQEQKAELSEEKTYVKDKLSMVGDWSSKTMLPVQPKKPDPMTKEEESKLMLQAQIEIVGVTKRVASAHALLATSHLNDFAPHLTELMESILVELKDLEDIIHMDIDYDKLSEKGKHDFQHFMMKREHLLTVFKKKD